MTAMPQRPTLSPQTLAALEEIDATDPDRLRHTSATADEPVEYGTQAWRQLGDDDPRKLHAVFAAADQWDRLLESPYAAEVLTAYYEWDDRRIHSEWTDAASLITREMGTPGPSYAELELLRADPGDAYRDRVAEHGEYLGGHVPWEPAAPTAVAA